LHPAAGAHLLGLRGGCANRTAPIPLRPKMLYDKREEMLDASSGRSAVPFEAGRLPDG